MVSPVIGPVQAVAPPRRPPRRCGHALALGASTMTLVALSAVGRATAAEPGPAAEAEEQSARADAPQTADGEGDAPAPMELRGADPATSASSASADPLATKQAAAAPEATDTLPAAQGDDATSTDEQAPPLVWAGSFSIAAAVAAAGVGSGMLLSYKGTGDSTEKWTSVGLYIGAGVAFVVGLSLTIVGSSETADAEQPDAPPPAARSVSLTPTAGGMLLHGSF